jgi:hypothetical protein
MDKLVADAWQWADGTGPARLLAELTSAGVSVLRIDDPETAATASLAPWAIAERLIGRGNVYMVERQPVRPLPAGRSFASNNEPTPLHTDSQLVGGVPPHIQVMLCVRAAASGGECLVLDTWPLLLSLEKEDPALLQRLFEVPRRIPFDFGDVLGPTVSWRGGNLVFTHSPKQIPGDIEAAVVRELIARAQPRVLAIHPGEVLVFNNHRMLHGRRGFADPQREFVRLLIWRKTPFPVPPALQKYAEQAASRTDEQLPSSAPLLRSHLGLAEPASAVARTRLELVLAMLRGVSPVRLAADSGVPEPELYRYRDAALAAATRALGDAELQASALTGAVGAVPLTRDQSMADALHLLSAQRPGPR